MINDLITQIIQKLKTADLEGMAVESFPDKPDSYIPLGQTGAVLVRYMGSVYSDPTATDIIVQERKMQFCVSVMMKSLRPVNEGIPTGVYSSVEKIKALLTGFKISGCAKFYITKDGYESNENGFWLYDIVFATTTKSFEVAE